MKEIVNIDGKEVERIYYKSKPVVTFRIIDELHQRPEGTARQTFGRHKERFIENEDYFDVPYEEWSEILCVCQTYAQNNRRDFIRFLTESGYLMIVKPFGDDISWKIQRILVNCYFIAREITNRTSDDICKDRLIETQKRLIEILEAENKMLRARIPENVTDRKNAILMQDINGNVFHYHRKIGKKGKRYIYKENLEDYDKCADLVRQGHRCSDIAKILSRSRSTIYSWMKKMKENAETGVTLSEP